MFGRKRNRKATVEVAESRRPRLVEVYWRGHATHPWIHLGNYDSEYDARSAAESMTHAQTDIRVHY